MALTFGTPLTTFDVGPASIVNVTIPAGPIPIDDYVVVEGRDNVNQALIIQGRRVTEGALTTGVVLGMRDDQVLAAGLIKHWGDGQTLCLKAFQFHADDTLVDVSGQSCGYVWRPQPNTWALIGLALNRQFPVP